MKMWKVKIGGKTVLRRAKSRRTLLKQFTMMEQAQITTIEQVRPVFR